MRMPWYTKGVSYLFARLSNLGLVFLQRLPPLPSHSSLPDAVFVFSLAWKGVFALAWKGVVLLSGFFWEKRSFCAIYWKVRWYLFPMGRLERRFPSFLR